LKFFSSSGADSGKKTSVAKITLIYLGAGWLWILASSVLMGLWFGGGIPVYEIVKGLLFVALTAFMLYGLLNKYIGELIAAHERIHKLAYLDEATGLPNAHSFFGKLEQCIGEGRPFLLLTLRVSRFEDLQVVYGSRQSQALMAAVAGRLAAFSDRRFFVSRTDASTFKIIAKLDGGMGYDAILQKVERELKAPFQIGPDEISPSLHIGIARYPGDGTDGDVLVHCAARSLSRARDAGVLYIPEPAAERTEHDRRRLLLEKDLRKALARGQFVQHYQPKISVATGRVTGLEALVRWHHPVRGTIPPGEFIPIAEQNGDIVPIGRWVLFEACRMARRLRDERNRHLPVSVNVSAKQFWQNIVGDVEDALAEAGLEPACLTLELTESVMFNPESAIRILSRLKAIGVRLAIDDFGTGYSSLAYLKRLPIDELKIDKSFVDEILAENRDRRIVQSMIAMAHHLNMTVVAEGVERKEQLDVLRSLGCDEVQGFYYARPMDSEALAGFLDSQP